MAASSTAPKTALLVISFIVGAIALVCGCLLMAAPGGELLMMEETVPALAVLPLAEVVFTNFFWAGVAMLLFLFIPNAIAFAMLIRRSPSASTAQVIAGVLLLLWCLVGVIYVPSVWMWLFLIVSIAQIALGGYDVTTKAPARA